MDNYNFIQQGWQCPLCKRVYSPSTPCCFTCGAEGMTKTTTDIDTSVVAETTFDDYLKEQLKDPEFKKEWNKLLDEERGGENADVQ